MPALSPIAPKSNVSNIKLDLARTAISESKSLQDQLVGVPQQFVNLMQQMSKAGYQAAQPALQSNAQSFGMQNLMSQTFNNAAAGEAGLFNALLGEKQAGAQIGLAEGFFKQDTGNLLGLSGLESQKSLSDIQQRLFGEIAKVRSPVYTSAVKRPK